jgi:hypothetical protein
MGELVLYSALVSDCVYVADHDLHQLFAETAAARSTH